MAAKKLVLVANPGSASRKYALFEGQHKRASLHFEWKHDQVVCTLRRGEESVSARTQASDLTKAAGEVVGILHANDILKEGEKISLISLRVVAPGSYFLQDRFIDDEFLAKLEAAKPKAPIHIAATLQELRILRKEFYGTLIAGISDSAFHANKPDYAWNYGISLELADRFEIKRFGYHGISTASVVHDLSKIEKLPQKLVVCHLGSGASVSAVHGGKSIDNTMGYSPLEGLIMSTRTGSIDPTASRVLKDMLELDDDTLDEYLNNQCGLLGLGGSADIRELLESEKQGDHRARLALDTYIYNVQKAIGQMAAALGGADALVFTGTVGERSAEIRHRVIERLHHLDFSVQPKTNEACTEPEKPVVVSRLAHSRPILVVPAKESNEMVRRAVRLSD